MYVYVIRNLINNKRYVGKANDYEYRWDLHERDANNGSHYAIHRAIRKYGINNFSFEVVDKLSSDKEAYAEETKWVTWFNSTTSGWGYNMTKGGEGVVPTEEVRQLMSERAIERWKVPGYSEKIAINLTNKWKDPEYREMMRGVHLGRKASEETRARLSVSQKRRYEDPEERERNRQAQLIAGQNPELKQLHRELIANQRKDPEFIRIMEEVYKRQRNLSEEERKVRGEIARAAMNTPEAKENLSKGQRSRYHTPEYFDMRSKAVSLYLEGVKVKDIAKVIGKCRRRTWQILCEEGVYESPRKKNEASNKS